MDRILHCPASWQRAQKLESESPSHPWTLTGQKAHAILAGEEPDDEEDYSLTRAVEICEQREQQLLIQLGFEDPVVFREDRLWLKDDAGNEVASGRPDAIYIQNGHALCLEYKTGFNDVVPPSLNPQLLVYAILGWRNYGAERFTLAIIPAWKKQPPIAEADVATLEQWRTRILEAIEETKSPEAHAEAGSHCAYCPVRPNCPECWAIVEEVASWKP